MPKEIKPKCAFKFENISCGSRIAQKCSNKCCLVHCEQLSKDKTLKCDYHENYRLEKRVRIAKARAIVAEKTFYAALSKMRALPPSIKPVSKQ